MPPRAQGGAASGARASNARKPAARAPPRPCGLPRARRPTPSRQWTCRVQISPQRLLSRSLTRAARAAHTRRGAYGGAVMCALNRRRRRRRTVAVNRLKWAGLEVRPRGVKRRARAQGDSAARGRIRRPLGWLASTRLMASPRLAGRLVAVATAGGRSGTESTLKLTRALCEPHTHTPRREICWMRLRTTSTSH